MQQRAEATKIASPAGFSNLWDTNGTELLNLQILSFYGDPLKIHIQHKDGEAMSHLEKPDKVEAILIVFQVYQPVFHTNLIWSFRGELGNTYPTASGVELAVTEKDSHTIKHQWKVTWHGLKYCGLASPSLCIITCYMKKGAPVKRAYSTRISPIHVICQQHIEIFNENTGPVVEGWKVNCDICSWVTGMLLLGFLYSSHTPAGYLLQANISQWTVLQVFCSFAIDSMLSSIRLFTLWGVVRTESGSPKDLGLLIKWASNYADV